MMPAQSQILNLSGLQGLMKKLAALGAKAETIAGAAIYQEAERIMAKSKHETPVDLGNLRATGVVSEPEIRGNHVVVTLGFGGPAAPYAIVQHERLDFVHKVGKAKFLEGPTLEAVAGMEARLGNRIKKGIEDAAK